MKRLRSELDLTQAAMARLLGLSLTGYANYESGEREPRADTLHELGRIAGERRLTKLEAVFDDAFRREAEQSKGPVTSEESAWSDAVVQLVRNDVLSAEIKQKIIAILEGGHGLGYKAVDEVALKLRVLSAESAEEKLELLVEAATRTGASPAQAYTAVLQGHPALAARIEFESRTKKGKENRNDR